MAESGDWAVIRRCQSSVADGNDEGVEEYHLSLRQRWWERQKQSVMLGAINNAIYTQLTAAGCGQESKKTSKVKSLDKVADNPSNVMHCMDSLDVLSCFNIMHQKITTRFRSLLYFTDEHSDVLWPSSSIGSHCNFHIPTQLCKQYRMIANITWIFSAVQLCSRDQKLRTWCRTPNLGNHPKSNSFFLSELPLQSLMLLLGWHPATWPIEILLYSTKTF